MAGQATLGDMSAMSGYVRASITERVYAALETASASTQDW